MAVLDHNHAHILQPDGRSKPSDAFCVVQFVLFWVGFFAVTYLASLLIGLVVS
jgi:hypothetical protein